MTCIRQDGFLPPPPPPKQVFKKSQPIKTSPQKTRFCILKKEVLANINVNLIHDPELRKQLPTDFKDVLCLDSTINVHVLIAPTITLSSVQIRRIMTLTMGLSQEKRAFNLFCEKVDRIFSTGGISSGSSVEGGLDQVPAEAESVDDALDALANQAEIVHDIVRQIKGLIDEYKSDIPHSKKALKFKEPSTEKGRKWYDELKRAYCIENEAVDPVAVKSLGEWAIHFYRETLVPPSVPLSISTIENIETVTYAMRILGGPEHFKINLANYQHKMLKKSER